VGLREDYLTDINKIRWKGGTWAVEKKLLDFGGNAWIMLR